MTCDARIGPTQLNIPRDFFYGDIECEIPRPIEIERGAGSEKAGQAALLLAGAKFRCCSPVAALMANGQAAAVELAEVPTGTGRVHLHNDAFPSTHPLWVGQPDFQGVEAAMKLIAKADVVLALGTRLGPFGTLPQLASATGRRRRKSSRLTRMRRCWGSSSRLPRHLRRRRRAAR